MKTILSTRFGSGSFSPRSKSRFNLETPIIDFGLYRALHKSKLYAFIKGLVDSGVKIKSAEKTFPEEARLKGEPTKNIPLQEIKSKIEKGLLPKKEVKSKNG